LLGIRDAVVTFDDFFEIMSDKIQENRPGHNIIFENSKKTHKFTNQLIIRGLKCFMLFMAIIWIVARLKNCTFVCRIY
jgi:hypothetical protein